MVRQVLVEEPVVVRGLLKALSELQINRHEQDRQLRQLQALPQPDESKTYELPADFDTSFLRVCRALVCQIGLYCCGSNPCRLWFDWR